MFKLRDLIPMAARTFAGRKRQVEQYWRLAMADDGAAELIIYGVIGQMEWMDEPSLQAQKLVREIGDIKASTIRVRISSPGGLVADAVAIYNALLRHHATIETYNDAEASSAASYLFMAGETRVMADNALLMVHSAWAFVGGNPAQLRKHAETLERQNEALIPAYARTGMSEDEVRTLLADGEDHWYTAAEAAEAGFSTETSEALAAAAQHSFDTHQPPAHLLAARPTPSPRTEPHAGALGSPTEPTAPTQPSGVNPMNWIAIAISLSLGLADNTTEAAAKQAVFRHLQLADDADDQAVLKALNAKATATAQPPAPSDGGVQTAVHQALAAESTRREQIGQRFARYADRQIPQLRELESRCVNDPHCTPESAGLQLLDLLGSTASPSGTGGPVSMGADEIDKRRDGMTNALLARMGVRDEANPVDASNPWRGLSLREMARQCLCNAGIDVTGLMPEEFADRALSFRTLGAGQTTSDFPVVLENTLHKMVLSGFMAQRTTWQEFCKTGDVTDFRSWNRLVPGLIGNLQTVNEAGEYLNKNLPDAEKNTIQATRKGNIIAVTPEVLINDDLGYIQTLASSLGQAGARTLDRAVYQLLSDNPALGDGTALFHADHNNLAGSGAAPTVTTLAAGRDAMARQTAPGDDAEFLDIVPNASVSSHEVKGDIEVQVNSQFDPEASNKLQRANKVRGMVSVLVGSPRISGNEWYLFADPNIAPVIEVVFLNGQREPRVSQEENFRTSGLAWKVEYPFGVGAIDYRGAWKNAGA